MKIAAKIIIITAVFLVGFYIGRNQAVAPETSSEPGEEAVAGLVAVIKIDFGSGEIVADEIAWAENETVFSQLVKAAEKNDLFLDYDDYGGELGALVKTIGDKSNNSAAGLFWQYWLNGDYGLVGASTQGIAAGGEVDWRYGEGQFIGQ